MEINLEHSDEILKKMFNVIGLKYDQDWIAATPEWFQKFSWTRAEYKEEFLTWLTNFLIEHKYATRKRARHQAEKFNAWYGWKEIA
jgi:hypothetical protein